MGREMFTQVVQQDAHLRQGFPGLEPDKVHRQTFRCKLGQNLNQAPLIEMPLNQPGRQLRNAVARQCCRHFAFAVTHRDAGMDDASLLIARQTALEKPRANLAHP